MQDYDFAMKTICGKYKSQFIRFADDQIIFTHDKETARLILFEASKELFKINLNINSSKVKEFASRAEFETYWAFEIFDLLRDKENKDAINCGVEKYFQLIDSNTRFKDSSVLKRLLTINFSLIEPKHRHRLISGFLTETFLFGLQLWHFRRIRVAVNNDSEFFGQLDTMIPTALFNSFLFNLRLFYSKDRKEFDLTVIDDRIKELENASR
ncbi:MAG: hypothetical protein IPP77_04505 [Bacteroidetes bacterium]|nr:hypothetical protein [Bacteroidota bacterium]